MRHIAILFLTIFFSGMISAGEFTGFTPDVLLDRVVATAKADAIALFTDMLDDDFHEDNWGPQLLPATATIFPGLKAGPDSLQLELAKSALLKDLYLIPKSLRHINTLLKDTNGKFFKKANTEDEHLGMAICWLARQYANNVDPGIDSILSDLLSGKNIDEAFKDKVFYKKKEEELKIFNINEFISEYESKWTKAKEPEERRRVLFAILSANCDKIDSDFKTIELSKGEVERLSILPIVDDIIKHAGVWETKRTYEEILQGSISILTAIRNEIYNKINMSSENKVHTFSFFSVNKVIINRDSDLKIGGSTETHLQVSDFILSTIRGRQSKNEIDPISLLYIAKGVIAKYQSDWVKADSPEKRRQVSISILTTIRDELDSIYNAYDPTSDKRKGCYHIFSFAINLLRKDYASASVELIQIANLGNVPQKDKNGPWLSKVLSIISALAGAANSKEAREVLDAAVAPPGTWRELRRGNDPSGQAVHVAVVGHLGLGGGISTARSENNKRSNWGGVVAPVGIQVNATWIDEWSLLPVGAGLLLSPVDLGTVAQYRLATRQETSKATWNDVLAPGVWVNLQLSRKAPISLLLGAEYAPRFRSDGGQRTTNALQFGVALSWEVPLLGIR
ncbi:hypothetical protein LBMAG53_23070 [Planctomycetota bacterium]|nr:hypothetical protein LBMAG53_23070 [Planctomycetota bacterium]